MFIEQELLLLQENKYSYFMFIPPDMSYVKCFRKKLKESLYENSFSNEDISKILLAADEALTNSISANVNQKCKEYLICRWRIQNHKLTLFIFDYGKGLTLSNEMNKENIHQYNSEKMCNFDFFQEYLDKIKKYQESKKHDLPFQGTTKSHKNMGYGLKIIFSLMDNVRILYHSNEEISEKLRPDSNGSILELEFKSTQS